MPAINPHQPARRTVARLFHKIRILLAQSRPAVHLALPFGVAGPGPAVRTRLNQVTAVSVCRVRSLNAPITIAKHHRRVSCSPPPPLAPPSG